MLFKVSEKDQKMKRLPIVDYYISFISAELLVRPTDIHSLMIPPHTHTFLACIP